jgi:hypothetical protein
MLIVYIVFKPTKLIISILKKTFKWFDLKFKLDKNSTKKMLRLTNSFQKFPRNFNFFFCLFFLF